MKVNIKVSDKILDNDYKRVFLISDIHNHYESFCKMRDSLNWGEGDLVIINGDIVDRGDSKADPLSLCSEIRFPQNRKYDVIMIKGNHEKWLAGAIRQYCISGRLEYRYNSLEILSKALDKEKLLEYADWMDGLPLGLEMEISGFKNKFKIAHASTKNISSEDETLMGTPDFYHQCLNEDENYINVVGHTVTCLIRCYFENSVDKAENDTDIFRVGNKLWCIDCGNGFREEQEEDDFSWKLGCVELCGQGRVIDHYV